MPQCLFCDATKLTQEHLWPDWVVARFRHLVEPAHGKFTSTIARADGRVIFRPAPDIEQTARVICKPCNEGWMSCVEAEAKPILDALLDGRKRGVFSREERMKLAIWITLRAMVFEGMERRGNYFFSQSARETFAGPRGFRPPKGASTWCATYGTTRDRATRATFYVRRREVPDVEGQYCVTGILGRLAFQFYAWKGLPRRMYWSKLARNGWDRRTAILWPERGPVHWPPAEAIYRHSFQSLIERFDAS